jgi:hypothetical protein
MPKHVHQKANADHRTTDHGSSSTNAALGASSQQPITAAPFVLGQQNIVGLQRQIGNQAVARLLGQTKPLHAKADIAPTQTDGELRSDIAQASSGPFVKLPLRGMVHPVAASMAHPSTRFRLPEFDRIKAAYTDKDLKIPEKVIQDRVAQLLGRMKFEKRLKSADDVPTIIAKIFPAPGKIDEAEFNNALDVADQKAIYHSVFDASTTVKTGDKPKLQTAMKDAANLITQVEGNSTGLKAVFGSQDATAKANYAKARKALGDVSKNMDTSVSTDYNLDDPEVNLGGWADFGAKHMHLLADVVKGTDIAETKATLIHEAAHLADSSVDDHVYYGLKGFFELGETTKVGNAAHYEELPRRLMNVSKFDGQTFTPGVKQGGGAVTREDTVQASAVDYLRHAWDAAVDTHSLIRGVRIAKLSNNGKPFTDNEALILEISKLMNLTIHEQAAGKAVVTTLDVTLTESIARGVAIVGSIGNKVPFPNPIGTLTDIELRDKIVEAAVTKYGNLLQDAKRDKALLDWLVAHYRSLPSA